MRRKWDDQSVAQLMQTFTGQTNGLGRCGQLFYRGQQRRALFIDIYFFDCSFKHLLWCSSEQVGVSSVSFSEAAESHLGLLQQVWWLRCQLWHFLCRQRRKAPFIRWVQTILQYNNNSSTVQAALALKTDLWRTEKLLLFSEGLTFLRD